MECARERGDYGEGKVLMEEEATGEGGEAAAGRHPLTQAPVFETLSMTHYGGGGGMGHMWCRATQDHYM